MSQQYLMAIDAGTGSVRAVIFSLDGEQTGCVQREWEHKEDPRYPGSMDFDWAHNWDLARECVQGVLKRDQVLLQNRSLPYPPPACEKVSSFMTKTAMKSGPVPM